MLEPLCRRSRARPPDHRWPCSSRCCWRWVCTGFVTEPGQAQAVVLPVKKDVLNAIHEMRPASGLSASSICGTLDLADISIIPECPLASTRVSSRSSLRPRGGLLKSDVSSRRLVGIHPTGSFSTRTRITIGLEKQQKTGGQISVIPAWDISSEDVARVLQGEASIASVWLLVLERVFQNLLRHA